MSLYTFENEVIRPLGEPRVHFALNCLVRGCPRLPPTPFVAERLDAGMVGVNEGIFSNEVVPFGGAKESALGREGAAEGLDEHPEIKYICLGAIDA